MKVTPEFVEDDGTLIDDFDAVTLSTNWEKFTVGPLDTTDLATFDDSARLAFVLEASGDEFYLDNIVLRQTEEAVTVIKDSWSTPASCDETPEGAVSINTCSAVPNITTAMATPLT